MQVKRAVCPHDCWDTCGMLAQVEGGRVLKVVGDPDHPITRGFLCVKVNAYHERVHHPDRVLYPHVRRAPKGRGGRDAFQRVSWDEAIGRIADRWKTLIAAHGPEVILPYSYAGTIGTLHYHSLDRRFFHYMGASRLARTICSSAGAEAMKLTLGARIGYDPEDMVEAKLIIVWGLNVLSSNVHQWPILEDARRRGARLVVIDPYRHATARRADLHLSPRPGTDAALALGLMHVLIFENLYDKEFVARSTHGFAELKERVAEYPPERAAEITGVRAADIAGLAREYARSRPAAIRVGYGVQRHTNGGAIVRAIACLPALAGHFGVPGGGFLLSNGQAPGLASLEGEELIRGNPRTINMVRIGEALESADPPIYSLYVYNSNPATVAPDQNRVIRGLLRSDLYTVVHEQHFTETCDYADVVLPATTNLEHLDLHTSYWHLYVQLNEPAIAPLGESKPNTEVFRMLARAMGYSEPKLLAGDEELIAEALASGHPHLEGITLAALRRNGGRMRLNVGVPSLHRRHVPFADGRFPTPSGKVEFYSERLAARGLDPLPGYEPPAESPDGSPDLHRVYPLQLVTPAAHHFLNSSFGNLASLRKKEKRPTIYLHPADAAARGIQTGDRVRVFNQRGSVVLFADVGDWSRPGVAVSPSIWWNARMDEIAGAENGGRGINALTSAALSDYGEGASFHTNLVQVELVPAAALPPTPPTEGATTCLNSRPGAGESSAAFPPRI